MPKVLQNVLYVLTRLKICRMKFFELKSFYIVTDIKEHQENKIKLLRSIDAMPQSSLSTTAEQVKTDWNLPEDYKRDYLDIFYDMIRPYMQEMVERLKCERWEIHNAWYQVYDKGDRHDWHTHARANYTNVYYLSLPNKSIKTQLYDVVSESIVENIEVKEGQILTFPAGVIHRSPVNETDDKKMIISFNSNFQGPCM